MLHRFNGGVADVEVFVFLLFAVVVLAGLGLRSGVPYPVVLVVGGLVIGLVPGLPSPAVNPDLIFFVFLPPLLYAAAIHVSPRELSDNAKPIGLLAIGLVLATIGAVALVANVVLGLPWAAAFVLGAVLGPTDPVSAAAVLDRLGVTGRAKTILQGESLVNDASGLTAYRVGLAAAAGTAGSLGHEGLNLLWIVAGGVGIGLVVGWVFAHLRRIVTDPSLDVALSLLTPFLAYIAAEKAHASGVLATVVAGLYISARLAGRDRARHPPAHARLLGLDRVPARRPAVRAHRRAGAVDHRPHRRRRSGHAEPVRAADRRGGDGRARAVDGRRPAPAAQRDDARPSAR